MNERIRELAEQAQNAYWADAQNFYESNYKDYMMAKFAELIVRECAGICMEMAAKCSGLPGEGALAKDCADWIKKDFGVEE